MSHTRQGRKIALVGANGNIGTPTLATLLSHDIHVITVISRLESTTTYPSGVVVKRGSFDDGTFLLQALQGQDALVLQLPIQASGLQDHFIDAAAKAGVKYVLPTEWGSDPAAKLVDEFLPLAEKREQRRLIEDLGVSSWVAIVNNPWFDFSLRNGSWGIDVKGRKAVLWNGGNTRINTTTTLRAGAATAELLSLPDSELSKYRHNPFFVSSFYVTQKEMLESVLRVTRTSEKEWDITRLSIEDLWQQCDERMKQGLVMEAFVAKFYSAHFIEGHGGDFNYKVSETSKSFYHEEDLDTVVQHTLATNGLV